jgi:hypothetical protein
METPTKEQVWATLQAPAELKLLPSTHGELMTVQEFYESINDGSFIDYDGFANWATETRYLPFVDVYPSKIKKGTMTKPRWVTHVVWYNR